MREFRLLLKTEFDARRLHGEIVTKQDLLALGENIMSAISEFAAKQKTFNDRLDAAVSGITGDIQSLNSTIEKLQGTAGAITPEDQTLLDEIEARSDAITKKLENLDAMNPPAVPA